MLPPTDNCFLTFEPDNLNVPNATDGLPYSIYFTPDNSKSEYSYQPVWDALSFLTKTWVPSSSLHPHQPPIHPPSHHHPFFLHTHSNSTFVYFPNPTIIGYNHPQSFQKPKFFIIPIVIMHDYEKLPVIYIFSPDTFIIAKKWIIIKKNCMSIIVCIYTHMKIIFLLFSMQPMTLFVVWLRGLVFPRKHLGLTVRVLWWRIWPPLSRPVKDHRHALHEEQVITFILIFFYVHSSFCLLIKLLLYYSTFV